MFKDIFFTSYLLTIAISLTFIFLNLVLANNIYLYSKKKNIFTNFRFSYLIFYYVVFLLDCIIFNFLILNKSGINAFYIYLFLKLIFLVISFEKFNFKPRLYIQKEYLLILTLFFLISLLPLSDADSINVHLNFPLAFFHNHENLLNLSKYAELSLFQNSEIILFNSVLLKSENIGSLLNYSSLLVFIFLEFSKPKNKGNFLVFVLSIPLILFLLNTQKLQVFFGILYLVIFIYFYENKSFFKKKIELAVIAFVFIFYLSGKISYILLAGPLFIYMLYRVKNPYFIIYFILPSILILFPLYLNKFFFYGNPLAPLFSNYFSSSEELLNLNKIINLQGWKNSGFNIVELISFIIPTSISKISSSAGFGLIYLLFKDKFQNLKSFHFVSFSGIFLIYAFGQIAPRFYLESLLLLFFFTNFKINKYTKYILNTQILIVGIISSAFLIYSIYLIGDKDEYYSKFSNSFHEAEKIKELKIKENILYLDEGRDSIFFSKNTFPISIKDNNEYLLNMIKKNEIKYIITSNVSKLPNCINKSIVNHISVKKGSRNFLNKNRFSIKNVYQISIAKCSI